jgi:hypothetical protein
MISGAHCCLRHSSRISIATVLDDKLDANLHKTAPADAENNCWVLLVVAEHAILVMSGEIILPDATIADIILNTCAGLFAVNEYKK